MAVRSLALRSRRPGPPPDTAAVSAPARPKTRRRLRSSGPTGAHLHALRGAFVLLIFWSASFSGTLHADWTHLLAWGAGYLLLFLVSEKLRRTWPRTQGAVTLLGLLADGVMLGWVLYLSGGILSPLRFLVYIHLIAATLVFSHRVGIAVTVMHTISLYVVYRVLPAGVVDFPSSFGSSIGEESMTLQQSWVFNAFVLWVIALATAPFSSVNERELRRRKDDLSAVADMAADFESLHDPEEIARTMLERICQSFDFKRGVVLAVREEELVVVARRGEVGTAPSSVRIDSVIDKAWDHHEALLQARLDEATDPLLSVLLPEARNLLVAPMFADGQPFGVLVVESARPNEAVIQRRVISLVMQFSSHAALAMRNAWLLQQVQLLADTDALTGVANRRSFEKALARDVSRSTRSREPLTLVMVDLDRFKQLNDHFGHQAGDEVLRKVGAVLRAACRESDVPARYGGEEFAVLLPSCSKDQAFAAAERLRQLVASVEAPVPITCSAGVAIYPLNASTPTQLVAAADEALYQSKRMGRDRSTLSPRRVLTAVASGNSS